MRINVVGTSGSGKSVFSQRIAQLLNAPHIQLDELHWKPNWEASSNEELLAKIERALSAEKWILDGNYAKTIPIKWKRVQMVVYLDLPFHVFLYRIIKRSLLRGITREPLWQGNRETVWQHFFTSKSMILWTIKTFHKNQRELTALMNNDDYSQIEFVRLRSKAELERFIAQGRFRGS